MMLTCCSSESDVKAQETQTPANGKKVLVAYFSFTSNTKAFAEKIAEMTGGDLYEIVPVVAYGSENSNYYDETTRAYKEQYNTGGEQRPAIKGTLDGRMLSKAQAVSSLKRGIYIIDGKKVAIK